MKVPTVLVALMSVLLVAGSPATQPATKAERQEYSDALAHRGATDQPIDRVPMMGDETSIVQVIADPQRFIGKPFVIVGGIKCTDIRDLDYQDTGRFFAFSFTEADADGRMGELANAYQPRPLGVDLIDLTTRFQQEHNGGKLMLVRLKVTLNPDRQPPSGINARALEILDWQFLCLDQSRWTAWWSQIAAADKRDKPRR
jgi:hypothetical protein